MVILPWKRRGGLPGAVWLVFLAGRAVVIGVGMLGWGVLLSVEGHV